MAMIKQDDLIQGVADALQLTSYYHPADSIQATYEAYLREKSPATCDSMVQILINSCMCATGHRPICQDTGIVTVLVRVDMNMRQDGATASVDDVINKGVCHAYNLPENVLRASVLANPVGTWKNIKDNTSAVIHYSIVPDDKVEAGVAVKGGDSENKSKMTMPSPSDSIVSWVLRTIPTMGIDWCPLGMLDISVGDIVEKVAMTTKKVLVDPVGIHELEARGSQNRIRELRLESFEKINQLGIGAQGLSGLTTVLDVRIMDYPAHVTSLPVCMISNCAAIHRAHFVLDGSGPAELEAPSLDAYPEVAWEVGPPTHRVDLDKITSEEAQGWKPGETLLLSGRMPTGRDAAHKRMVDMLNKDETLPMGLRGCFIYYVGPVDPVGGGVVDSAGPTTTIRTDKFTRQTLEQTNLLGMIGKFERGPIAIEMIKDNRAVYLMAVGGATYLIAQTIKESRVLAFARPGTEAIYEFEAKDIPVTVAIDTSGESVHITGPAVWQKEITESLAVGIRQACSTPRRARPRAGLFRAATGRSLD